MITRAENQTTLRPEGDVVAGAVPELRTALHGLMREDVRELVIDLANVGMVDSMGLGLLIATHNSLRKVGGQLSVVRASADILQLLTTMRIHQHFSITGE